MKPRTAKSQHPDPNGFTLLEVVLAMVLLMGSAMIFMDFSVDDQQRDYDRQVRLHAEMIAQNEISRLRVTVPFSLIAPQTWFTNENGEVVTQQGSQWCRNGVCYPNSAVYQVNVVPSTLCDGGPIVVDNLSAVPDPHGCASRRPTTQYDVTIIYPSRTAPLGKDTVDHRITTGPVGLYVDNTWSPSTQP